MAASSLSMKIDAEDLAEGVEAARGVALTVPSGQLQRRRGLLDAQPLQEAQHHHGPVPAGNRRAARIRSRSSTAPVASGTGRSGMAWLCDCSRRHHGRRVSSIAARTTAVRA